MAERTGRDRDEIRSTLHELIRTCEDGAHGFATAAGHVRDTQLASLLADYGRERERFADELRVELGRIGGEARAERSEEKGSVTGALHRGWIGLKSAITAGGDEAILSEAERGEDHAVKAYRDALGKDLPADLMAVIERQAARVKEVHDRVRARRDRARRAA